MPLVQDSLLYVLPGWYVEHDEHESCAQAEDGSLLLVRVARHPHAGWGLMVALGGEVYACNAETAVTLGVRLNRLESDRTGRGPSPGCWAYNGAGLEYRAFLPAALLDAANDPMAGAAFVQTIVAAVARRAASDLVHHDTPSPVGPVLERPAWPGDHDAASLARRDPINDGLNDPGGMVYLDRMGRACAITEASFQRWRSRLLPEDHGEVDGFIRWAESCLADRAARRASAAANRPDGRGAG